MARRSTYSKEHSTDRRSSDQQRVFELRDPNPQFGYPYVLAGVTAGYLFDWAVDEESGFVGLYNGGELGRTPTAIAYCDANSGDGRAGLIDDIAGETAGLSVCCERQEGCRCQENGGASNCHAASMRAIGTHFRLHLALLVWRSRRNLRAWWCRL